MTADEVFDIADALGRAASVGDTATLGRLYTDDAVIWHNTNNLEQSRADNLALLSKIPEMFTGFKYINIRRSLLEDGLVQQHDLSVIYKDGTQEIVHVCMIIRIRGGRISRIDEYFDTAQASFAAPPQT